MTKQIAVIGLGYVGLPLATLLAHSGYQVYAVDINPSRVEAVRQGRSFFYEQGLDSLVRWAIKNKKLMVTDDLKTAIPKSQFVFSCVGTPDNPDGSSNLEYVFSAARDATKLMKPGTIYIQKSTVPVGTGAKIEKRFGRKKIAYVSNPEFLREGTAVADSLWPDRIVVGSDSQIAAKKVLGLYRDINKHRGLIARRAKVKPLAGNGQEIITSRNSAELIKVAANAFLALKISFANSIAKLADQTEADVTEIMAGVGSDKRIGPAFFNAGRGYGGGCFPKDVSGLISSAQQYGVDLDIMQAATELNDSMPGYIANKAKPKLGSYKGKSVAVLGLAFKAGTSDVRRSPGIKLANLLARAGARVKVFDPEANGEAEEELKSGIELGHDVWQTITGCRAVFITTDWPQFLKLDLKKLRRQMKGDLFVDAVNGFDRKKVGKAKFVYLGIGRN